MNRRALSLALACALSLSLLSACGGKDNSSSSAPVSNGSSASASTSDASVPDVSQPDASAPDASQPEGSVSTPDVSVPVVTASLSLSKNDFTLKAAGATWKLKAAATGVDKAEFVWSSSDESVAAVSDDGTVTAVAPGTATITVECGELTAQCVVRCRWEEKTESEKPDSSSGSSSSVPSAKVDLAAFCATVTGAYEFSSSLVQSDKEMTDAFYPGLGDIATEQCLVYAPMMSMNLGELAVVQVKDSKDVDAVKAILQTRIDDMINGGAWYPEPTRVWTECSKVVSNGNYIMMVVHEEYQSIVEDFNALF